MKKIKRQKNSLSPITGLTACTSLIRTALHVPFIKDEKPVGILIVSKPGMGKSMLLTRFHSDNIVLLNDLTGYGLERTVIELEGKSCGYIVVPDMLKIMSRTKGWEAFLTLTNILLEEGLTSVRRFDINIKFKQPVHFGIITAITSDALRQNLTYLTGIGFTSRFGIFNYDYEPSDYSRVETLISRQAPDDNLVFEMDCAKMNADRVKVAVNADMAQYIRLLGRLMAASNGRAMSFRSISFARRMAKGHALVCGRKHVAFPDIEETLSLLPFFVSSNPAATDLEYAILRGKRKADLIRRYTPEEILGAEKRLVTRRLSRNLLTSSKELLPFEPNGG